MIHRLLFALAVALSACTPYFDLDADTDTPPRLFVQATLSAQAGADIIVNRAVLAGDSALYRDIAFPHAKIWISDSSGVQTISVAHISGGHYSAQAGLFSFGPEQKWRLIVAAEGYDTIRSTYISLPKAPLLDSVIYEKTDITSGSNRILGRCRFFFKDRPEQQDYYAISLDVRLAGRAFIPVFSLASLPGRTLCEIAKITGPQSEVFNDDCFEGSRQHQADVLFEQAVFLDYKNPNAPLDSAYLSFASVNASFYQYAWSLSQPQFINAGFAEPKIHATNLDKGLGFFTGVNGQLHRFAIRH